MINLALTEQWGLLAKDSSLDNDNYCNKQRMLAAAAQRSDQRMEKPQGGDKVLESAIKRRHSHEQGETRREDLAGGEAVVQKDPGFPVGH